MAGFFVKSFGIHYHPKRSGNNSFVSSKQQISFSRADKSVSRLFAGRERVKDTYSQHTYRTFTGYGIICIRWTSSNSWSFYSSLELN